MLLRSATLSSLLLLVPLGAQGPAKPLGRDEVRKLEKSLLVANDSTAPYRLILLAPEADRASALGSLEVRTWDRVKGALAYQGALEPGKDLAVPPGSELLLSPVPEKSVGSRLGLSQRADFNRLLMLKDRASHLVVFRLLRSGSGDKAPELRLDRARGIQVERSLRMEVDPGGLPSLVITQPTLK